MHIIASFSLTAGLIAATLSAPGNLLPAPANRLSTSRTELNTAVEPGLTRMLPPVYFCGESVPLHEEAVARRLLSALVKNTSQNQVMYRIRQRAAVFFPIIEPILARHHIPLDFKYLPLVESALTGLAVSPRGAVGYWQFMPATARELGLSIEPGHDERQHLIKSTNAACRYLRYLHNRLGSWTLTAAAYNNGIGALLANIRRQQQRDYYYLRLNAETGKYLYRILAFKELFSNSNAYQHLIPERMMAYLSEPLNAANTPDDTEILLPETILEEATAVAVNAVVRDVQQPAIGQTDDVPLPNASDVFRGGIKARLTEAGDLQRGKIWVFHLIRNGMTDGRSVEEGDILYAVVEDIDQKTGRIYLRADKLYSTSDRYTYNLSLSAIDASTGRIGIKIPEVDQLREGWTLTWKAL